MLSHNLDGMTPDQIKVLAGYGALAVKVASIPGASLSFTLSEDRKRLISHFHFDKAKADSILGHN